MSTSSPVILSIPGKFITYAHSILAAVAFGSALLLACGMHYKLVVQNGVAGYPQEWFPSVSASIGDHQPERPLFQIIIATCSGPRFLLILLQWLVHTRVPLTASNEKKQKKFESRAGNWADVLAVVGVLRTFSCGGWVYVTSSNSGTFHDICMIIYLVLTIPYTALVIYLTPEEKGINTKSNQLSTKGNLRKWIAGFFFGCLIPMIWFFVKHKSKGVPGAYTYYALFEWSLIALDVAFDSISAAELSGLRLQIVDAPSEVKEEFFISPDLTKPATVENSAYELSAAESGWVASPTSRKLSGSRSTQSPSLSTRRLMKTFWKGALWLVLVALTSSLLLGVKADTEMINFDAKLTCPASVVTVLHQGEIDHLPKIVTKQSVTLQVPEDGKDLYVLVHLDSVRIQHEAYSARVSSLASSQYAYNLQAQPYLHLNDSTQSSYNQLLTVSFTPHLHTNNTYSSAPESFQLTIDPLVKGIPASAIPTISLVVLMALLAIPLSNVVVDMFSPPEALKGPSASRSWVAYVSDVYMAYCFWTIFTALGLQLFYFSVWELALSGSELALFSTSSPWILAYPSISRYATSRRGQSILRGTSLALGLGAWALPSPLWRLLAISTANATLWLGLGGSLSRLKGSESARIEGLILGCGLVISLLLKLVNYSNNPLWPIVDSESGGWNRLGLCLAGLCWMEKHYRPLELEPHGVDASDHKKSSVITPPPPSETSLILGCGAFLFMVQTLMTDAGTVVVWTWTGYPIKGPELLPHGWMIIGSIVLGLLASQSDRARSISSSYPGATFLPAIGAASLIYLQDWTSFYGGCALVFSLSLSFSSFIQAVSAVGPARMGHVLGLVMLTFAMFNVVSVLTVAYAFVPGGQLFRERMDVVMELSLVLMVWASPHLKALSVIKPVSAASVARRNKAVQIQSIYCLVGFGVAGLALSYWLLHSAVPVLPYHSSSTRVWTGGIWAVHFGVDLEGRDSQRRMMELIRDMQVDVVGLLETDLGRFVYGNRDLTRRIAAELGYYVDYGPGPNKHTWGAALLSKFPILESEHHLLPSPRGELAPAIYAKLLIHGKPINVIVSHNGQEEDPLDRELQSTALARIMSDRYPEPFAFLGYLVTNVGAVRPAPYGIIMSEGKMFDIEIEDRKRWCQYIGFRGMWRVGYARVTPSTISDTELQVGRWVLAGDHPVDYQTNEELYYHVGEWAIPEEWKFTPIFRDNGTRGHQYEVFDGPIYYHPPARAIHDTSNWFKQMEEEAKANAEVESEGTTATQSAADGCQTQ